MRHTITAPDAREGESKLSAVDIAWKTRESQSMPFTRNNASRSGSLQVELADVYTPESSGNPEMSPPFTTNDSILRTSTANFMERVTGASIVDFQGGETSRESVLDSNHSWLANHVPQEGEEARAAKLDGIAAAFYLRTGVNFVPNMCRKSDQVPYYLGLFLPILFCIIVAGCQNVIDETNPKVGRCLAVVILVAGWWLAGPFPSFATSLSPLFLFPMAGISTSAALSEKYFSSSVPLILGAFLVDLCIEESGLGTRFGLVGLSLFGNKPVALILGIMVIAFTLSAFCLNTSVAMMLLPFTLSIVEQIEGTNLDRPEDARKFAIAALLGVAYGSTCGGMATTIGMGGNTVLVGILSEEFGEDGTISFGQWFAWCAPTALIMLFFAFATLYFKWMRGVVLKVPEDIIVSKIKALGKVKRDEWIVLAAQLAQIIFWFSREPSVEGTHGWSEKPPDGINPHGTSYFNDGTVAIFWAFPLFLIPSSQRPGEAILSKAMLKHISWDIILMMGAGFAISKGVQESGTSDWLGAKIAGWIEFTPYLFMLLMVFVIANLTEVASNTATATILAPTLIAAAVSADKDPIAVCLPAIISCSAAWMLPMATPPNAIVFSAGRMTFSDMMSTGAWMNAISTFLLPVLILGIMLPSAGIGNFAKLGESPDYVYGEGDDIAE